MATLLERCAAMMEEVGDVLNQDGHPSQKVSTIAAGLYQIAEQGSREARSGECYAA